jgi:hypothetical protein
MFEGLCAGRCALRDLKDGAAGKIKYGFRKPGTSGPHGLAVARKPTLRGRRSRTGTGFAIPPLRAGLGRNKPMYIGLGTIALIVIIVLVVLMLRRRLCLGRLVLDLPREFTRQLHSSTWTENFMGAEAT